MESRTLLEFHPYEKLILSKSTPPHYDLVIQLEKWRTLLFKLRMIKTCPSKKVGFGDFSLRTQSKPLQFTISGEGTHQIPYLNNFQYVKIMDCDQDKKQIKAEGTIAPSHKCLMHHLIYTKLEDSKVIFQIYHQELWKKLSHLPQVVMMSNEDFPYLRDHAAKLNTHQSLIIVHKDIKDFITVVGKKSQDTGKLILDLYRQVPSWN